MIKKNCKLLPHTREDLYGFNSQSMQMIPWSIKEFDVEKAWQKSTGSKVIVAVIDTGCDKDHPDIKDNLLNGYNCIDNNSNVDDDNGHGTHVAGTIGAINNNLGIVGTAPNVKILPVKVLNNKGEGNNISVGNGVKWAVDNGAHIITMSLGSPLTDKYLEKSIEYAVENNVVIFCAAGNSGNNMDIMYPAKLDTTISVGSIGRNLEISNFSCCGDGLDFVAPGEDIISCVPNNSYASMSGTSMATPYAVGCASLLLSYKNLAIKHKNEYIQEFKKEAIHIKGMYSGQKRYEGNGIILPKF